jgi:tetrahydromethanopterin S-methyltransferase subunit F
MKGKATNEQLAKVLEYTLSEHQKNIEKSEKERNIFLKEFENQIETLKNVSLKPNLAEFERLNEQLEKGAINGAEKIKSAVNSAYFSPLILGIVFTVFISGAGMLIYSFKKIQTANEVADAKELALKNYFSKFLKENPKANESYKYWNEKQ